ncbi:MAG: 30S ribosomal protein S5 [Minisyncoccota bacterium]
MDEPIITTESEDTMVAETPVVPAPPVANTRPQSRDQRGDSHGGPRKNNRRGPRRDGRVKSEFDQKIVSLRRVTRVTSGGRRFAFSVCVVAGNKKGMVGVGQGKAGDTPLAIEKAVRDAKKSMITVNATREMSVPHEVEAKFSASRVVIRRAPGKGVLAGGSVRAVLELAGMKEVSAKLLSRSKNNINNAYAAIKALEQLAHTKIKHK